MLRCSLDPAVWDVNLEDLDESGSDIIGFGDSSTIGSNKSKANCIVSGIVYAAAIRGGGVSIGIPEANAHLVDITNIDDSGDGIEEGTRVKTNADGRFTFESLKLETYTVSVEETWALLDAQKNLGYC